MAGVPFFVRVCVNWKQDHTVSAALMQARPRVDAAVDRIVARRRVGLVDGRVTEPVGPQIWDDRLADARTRTHTVNDAREDVGGARAPRHDIA